MSDDICAEPLSKVGLPVIPLNATFVAVVAVVALPDKSPLNVVVVIVLVLGLYRSPASVLNSPSPSAVAVNGTYLLVFVLSADNAMLSAFTAFVAFAAVPVACDKSTCALLLIKVLPNSVSAVVNLVDIEDETDFKSELDNSEIVTLPKEPVEVDEPLIIFKLPDKAPLQEPLISEAI